MSLTKEQALNELCASLDKRYRPEEVALLVLDATKSRLYGTEKKKLERAAKYARRWSSMTSDFRRPDSMAKQLQVASELFRTRGVPKASRENLPAIDKYLARVQKEIRKPAGRNSFREDRMDRGARRKAGLSRMSKRRYNKLFRLAVRMEKKRARLAEAWEKRSYSQIAKSRLAFQIPKKDLKDVNTAAFVAYYTARSNLRSTFTINPQERPLDEIADMLLKRCQRGRNTNWFAIAHVLLTVEVLNKLTDRQKGRLLAKWYKTLRDIAAFMGKVWKANDFDRKTMIVRRGNDSSTWNSVAGAWNKARDAWVAVTYCMGLDEIKNSCPGKAMRLIAGDVAWWHRSAGDDVTHGDNKVWEELPLPWEVLLEDKPCPASLVREVCEKHGLDPEKSGWIAPKPKQKVRPFKPTPELVHGVTVDSPELATLFRKAGVFSGKWTKGYADPYEVADARRKHHEEVESRRAKKKKTTKKVDKKRREK